MQLTLRDTDETRLLARLATVLKQYPVPAGQGEHQTAGKRCPIHGVPMRLNTGNDGKTWYSHKTVDDWCKGRARPPR